MLCWTFLLEMSILRLKIKWTNLPNKQYRHDDFLLTAIVSLIMVHKPVPNSLKLNQAFGEEKKWPNLNH